jgi:hypothetical protein
MDAGPAARILSSSPSATKRATSATRREAGVTGFDCGAGGVSTGVIPPSRWLRLYRLSVSEILPARLRAVYSETEGYEGP